MASDLTKIKFNKERSVHSIAKDLLFNDYRYISIAVFSVAVLTALYLLFAFLAIVIAIFTVFWISLAYFMYLRHKAVGRFMKVFAEDNGLEYKKTAPLSSVSGKLFDRGGSRSISNVVKAKFKDQDTRLFHYRYQVKQGKNTHIYSFTVWEIAFEKTEFPHILLRSRKMPRYSTLQRDEKRVSLEKGYGKHFQLFVTKKYEIEALQIFTPEVLQMLCEKGANYSIEFAGKSIYIYDDVTVSSTDGLREIYGVTREVFDRTGPLINRLHNDFEEMHHYYR